MYRNASSTSLMRRSALTVTAGALLLGVALTGCSSSSSTPSSSAPAASASPTEGEDMPGTEEMRALCDQMIADGLTPEDATALAENAGYVGRVGTIDGEPQAVTMDFREDRFTFEVTGGKVTACTYG